MSVTIADGLLEQLRRSSGSQSLQLRGAPDPEAAKRGMRAARRHQSAEAFPGLLEQVLDTVVAVLNSSGVEAGTLTWPDDER
jgi:hypothetical protein